MKIIDNVDCCILNLILQPTSCCSHDTRIGGEKSSMFSDFPLFFKVFVCLFVYFSFAFVHLIF